MARPLLAEFDSAERCAEAVRRLRHLGYRNLDAFMPYEAEEVIEALEMGRSPLSWYVFIGGLGGAALAYLLVWYTQAIDYPLIIGNRPAHSAPAYIPITFETMVLFGGLTAFFGVFALCRLPRLHHPLFEVEGFERATIDRFFVVVDGQAGGPGVERGEEVLRELAPLRVERIEEGTI